MPENILLNENTLKVERENAHALIKGITTIFVAHKDAVSLKKDFYSMPKLITSKRSGHKKIYPLSSKGESLDTRFYTYNYPARYIAVLDTIFHIKNRFEIWEKLCNSEIFPIWLPKAPYNMLSYDSRNNPVHRRDPMILVLRVFEIDHDFKNEVIPMQYYDKIPQREVHIIKKIIPDQEFDRKKEYIRHTSQEILGKTEYTEDLVESTNSFLAVNEDTSKIKPKEISEIANIQTKIGQLPSSDQEKIANWINTIVISEKSHRYHAEKTIKDYFNNTALPEIRRLTENRNISIDIDKITIEIFNGKDVNVKIDK